MVRDQPMHGLPRRRPLRADRVVRQLRLVAQPRAAQTPIPVTLGLGPAVIDLNRDPRHQHPTRAAHNRAAVEATNANGERPELVAQVVERNGPMPVQPVRPPFGQSDSRGARVSRSLRPPSSAATGGSSRHSAAAAARPLRVQAVQNRPSEAIRGNCRERDESQQPRGLAPLPAASATAAVSPVTPEVAGSSPVAPVPKRRCTPAASRSSATAPPPGSGRPRRRERLRSLGARGPDP